MQHDQHVSFAKLERHIDAARQLRAETVASRIRLGESLAGFKILLRRIASLITDLMPRQA